MTYATLYTITHNSLNVKLEKVWHTGIRVDVWYSLKFDRFGEFRKKDTLYHINYYFLFITELHYSTEVSYCLKQQGVTATLGPILESQPS